jgi:hypothetical protein
MTNIEHQTAAANRGASLARTTFKTSRLLDFCSERELVKQIGHGVDHWPLVILKELLDNAIDAAEEANTVPVIGIKVATGEITITDNGPGIPAESITGILDFSVQVSSREAYASPTRGAQGNALKTIVAMAFALDGAKGETVIESQGITHRITFRVDQVRQEPKTEHIREPSSIKKGTRVTVRWPVCASSKLDQAKPHFLQMASDFGWLNPHLATLSVTWNGQASVDFKASDRAWSKWRPSDPTSPHWYDARLRRLMGAYIARDHDHGHDLRTVREFISEFRGLSASAKQKLVLEAAGAARLCCEELGDPVIVDPITVAEELGERKLAAEMCAPLCTRRYSFLNKVELQHPWRAASRYVASARSRSLHPARFRQVWRSSTSGCAWRMSGDLISSPSPRSTKAMTETGERTCCRTARPPVKRSICSGDASS